MERRPLHFLYVSLSNGCQMLFFIKSVFVEWLCLGTFTGKIVHTHQWFLFRINITISDTKKLLFLPRDTKLSHEWILKFILLFAVFSLSLSLFSRTIQSHVRFCYWNPLNFRAFWDSVYIEMAFTMWHESWRRRCSIESDTGEYRMRLYVRGITLADKEG